MIAFIDTSTLVKKYVQEEGSDDFSSFLQEIQEIVVAPIYLVELSSAIRRKSNRKEMMPAQATWLITEAKRDLFYFISAKWGEELEEEACRLIYEHNIKTLDAIQLASAVLAKPDIFITSDKKLYQSAKKELKAVKFI